ncbi:MAG: hypothetical protein ACM33B_13650 [Pseudomonadota bacterium]
MPPFRRILQGIVAAFAALLYVWFAGVRAVPRVKRRKLARGIGATARRASWRR